MDRDMGVYGIDLFLIGYFANLNSNVRYCSII